MPRKALNEGVGYNYSRDSDNDAFKKINDMTKELFPITESSAFSGVLDLSSVGGKLHDDHVQTGAITLSVGPNAVPGGWDLIAITANGSAINVPAGWVLYGGDTISTVSGNVNHIQVYYKNANRVYYSNRVVTP